MMAAYKDTFLHKETAAEIAARLRAGKPPARPIVWIELIDGRSADLAAIAALTTTPFGRSLLTIEDIETLQRALGVEASERP